MQSPNLDFDPKPVLELDGYLKPEIPAIATRWKSFMQWKKTIEDSEGGYDAFSKGYETFGFNVKSDNSIVYREWAPNATEAALTGEFSEFEPSISFSPHFLRLCANFSIPVIFQMDGVGRRI